VRGRDNAVGGWLLVFHDLTEEHALADLRDEWAHMLVHDLRAPVSVLKGTLDMFRALLQAGRSEDMDRLVVSARQGVDRLLDLINELLDINRLENGKLPLHREAVQAEPFLREVAGRLEPLVTPARIQIELAVEEGLPMLNVDPELIARVLINLLDNALKFTQNGGRIRLWARRSKGEEPVGVTLGVSDDGPGIVAEDQPYLFKKFQQLPSQGRRTGTGLGLAFCKLVVEAHEGCIGVESVPGRGTTFLVSLPSVTERL
jgi:signal transduction histidine kinase